MIEDLFDCISNAQSCLSVTNIKLGEKNFVKARKSANAAKLFLETGKQDSLKRDVELLIRLIDQNNIQKSQIFLKDLQSKLARFLRDEHTILIICRKCGWKNKKEDVYCANCRYGLK